MNNLHLNTKISLGVKILIALICLVILHNASSILNNLGIITDLFIIIGVYQSGKFLTNKEIRTSVIDKSKEIIDFESFDGFIDNVIDLINNTATEASKTEVSDFKFNIDDLLDSNPLTTSTEKEEVKSSFTIKKTYDDSTQFNGINN
mgnify:CR=1 FL=1